MLSRSIKIFTGIIIIYALLSAITVFLPQGDLLNQYKLPASKPVIATAIFFMMLIFYGGLGLIGIILSNKLGFTGIWDNKVSNKQRFLIPAIVGAAIGIVFIFTDLVFSKFNSLGPIPHPPFPTSLAASVTAGIGEELLFRLFFISFWVWLISFVFFKKKWENQIFWVITVFSALAFSMGHLPSVMVIFRLHSFSQVPPVFLGELIFLNSLLSVFAAIYFRKYGFLAAVGIHFWTDLIWHVVYGIM